MNLFFSEQSKELAVMATAALPIIELRGAIPFGIALGLTPTYTFLLSLFGSMIPVPLLIWLIRPVFAYMRRTEFLGKIVDKICSRSLAKSDSVQKYGFWGLEIDSREQRTALSLIYYQNLQIAFRLYPF